MPRPGLGDNYDKLDVEPGYLARGGTALRLAMIYGEHDGQRREEFILRRVRAGRRRIPVGPGTSLDTRCYVGDVAAAVLAALEPSRGRCAGTSLTRRPIPTRTSPPTTAR